MTMEDAERAVLEKTYLHSAQEGDVEMSGQVVMLHQARLRSFAVRWVPNQEDAADLVQEAFIDALKSLNRFDLERDFGVWLRAICKNRIAYQSGLRP